LLQPAAANQHQNDAGHGGPESFHTAEGAAVAADESALAVRLSAQPTPELKCAETKHQ
jgi:hypothetical protein